GRRRPPVRRQRHRHALHARARVEGHPGRHRRRPRADRGRRRRTLRARHPQSGCRPGRGRPAMIPAPFDYAAPTTVPEALSLLAEHGDEAKVLAGGQSLLPVLRMRLNAPEMLVDLGKLTELVGVTDLGDRLRIGAMTPYYQLLADPLVTAHAG